MQAAIEYSHGLVTAPLEHPPQAAAVVHAIAVVHHHLGIVVEAHALQPCGKHVTLGQGVTPTVDTQGGIVCGEVLVQVSVLRACDVLLGILGVARIWVHQIKGAIKHGQGGAVGV